MNVILTDEYPPVGGGAGVVAKTLYDNVKSKHPTKLIFRKAKTSRLRFLIAVIFFLLSLAFNKKIKILVINDFFAACVCGLFFRFIKKEWLNVERIILLTHGSEIRLINNQSKLASFVASRNNYKKILKCVDEIIYPSEYLKKTFEATSDFNYGRKSIVKYYGISPYWFDLSYKVTVKSSNKNGLLKIATVARVVKSKGFFEMLTALAETATCDKKIVWSILGDGSYLNELKSISKSYISKNFEIIFYGRCGREFIKTILTANDLFMLIPNEPEAFGLVYIEAQSMGLPCIGASHSGIIEAIKPGCGHLVSHHADLVRTLQQFNPNNFSVAQITSSARYYDSRALSNYIFS